MPNLTQLTINDGADTPVTHTFSPASRGDGSVAIYTESDGTPIGDSRLTIVPAKPNGSKRKCSLVLAIPVTTNETVNGVVKPIVLRTGYARCEFTFDKESTTQERDDIITMISNALAPSQTQVRDFLEDLEGVW